jgi:chromosomal replication initiator protein
MAFTPEVWDGVVRRLRLELPPFICDAFISNLTVESRDDGLVILCPTAFHRDRVRDHYRSTIANCLSAEMGRVTGFEIAVGSQAASTQAAALNRAPEVGRVLATARAASDTTTPIAQAPRLAPARSTVRPVASLAAPATSHEEPIARPVQRPLLRAQHTFESFVVGECNALAREASLALLRDDDPAIKQLYLCSGRGLGKTHLARAMCTEARARGRRPLYTSAEAFTNEFLASLRNRQIERFKRKFRQEHDVLIIEDVGFLEGKESTQLEFFHTVQHLCDAGARTVFTGSRLPQAYTALDARVRSQISEGFVAELGPPDAQVRRTILRSKAAAGGVHLPEESIDMLVDAVRGSVRDLESVLIQLVTTASLLKQKIDRKLTEEALDKKGAEIGRLLPRMEIPAVIELVAGSFKTTSEDMAGKSRRKEILVPRQLAMYLCRRYTDASLAEIGRALGRDHPSVRNAIAKVERAILEKAPLRYQVEELARQLDERSGKNR